MQLLKRPVRQHRSHAPSSFANLECYSREISEKQVPRPPPVRPSHQDLWAIRMAELRDCPEAEEELWRWSRAPAQAGRRDGAELWCWSVVPE